MADFFRYDKVTKYRVIANCTEPLHVGSADGDGTDVLVHPVTNLPFVQASSIAGVFRSNYCAWFGEKKADELFGSNREITEGGGSRVRFSDGSFLEGQDVRIELRPRVAINRETGTCAKAVGKGASAASGQKFNMKYIGAGVRLAFEIYLFGDGNREEFEQLFSAIDEKQLQFGGQKSNGCGFLKIEQLFRKEFILTVPEDRALWMEEEQLMDSRYDDITGELVKSANQRDAYDILVEGATEGEILVKAIAVSDYGKGAPDVMNIRNAAGDYIIPGSSIKGAVRSQMERIATYLGCEGVIAGTFGTGSGSGSSGTTGNIVFADAVIGTQEDNDRNRLSHRIHIDKFTGGVMQQGLFTEKNAFGDVAFSVRIKEKNSPAASCGLLLMALRDLAIGTMSLGSGYNVGKGIIQVDRITVTDKEGNQAVFDFKENRIMDDGKIAEKCIKAARGE